MLVTPGALVTEMRGSVGGVTASRNRYGQYFRNRAVPVNPNTARQVSARDMFNTLATAWRDTLTQAQRDGWDVYGDGTNWKNRVGQTVHLTGMNHFVRSNLFRLRTGSAVVPTAPVVLGLPDQEDLWSLAADATTQQVTITYTFATDVDDQDYAFFQGHPVDGSRIFFAGPWRGLASIKGDNGAPPASPVVAASAYVIGAAQKCFVYCRRLDDDMRLTEPFRRDAIVT